MWEVQLIPALVHTAFVLSLMSVASLIAVWAALSPRHRLLRLAGFCVLPAAFLLASAPWLSIWFLMEMLPITAALIVGPFVARAPFGRTWLGLPKVRFGFRDLFYGTFLVAFGLSAAILMSKQEYLPPLRLVEPWIIAPLSLWLPVSGATALVVGTRSRFERIAWMIVGCTVGSAAWYCSIWAFEGVFHWWDTSGQWFDLRYAWWLGGLVPCLVALMVAGQLSIGRGARSRARSSDEPSSAFRQRSWMVARIAATAILVAPACVIYYELARPVPIPLSELPTPNGYDRLVAVGRELSEPTLNAKRRDQLVQEARETLNLPSLVSVDFSQMDMGGIQSLRVLARALDADAKAHQAAGEYETALALRLDLLELGDRTERGGTVLDLLLGVAFESMAARGITDLAPSLSGAKCQVVLGGLQRFDRDLEPLENILAREYAYSRHSIGWLGRWLEAVESLSRTHRSGRMAAEYRNMARGWLRVASCELAMQAHHADGGRYPDSLDELVPIYLEAVPNDPFDGEPIKFSKDAAQYTICTTGEHLSSRARTAPTIVRQIAP